MVIALILFAGSAAAQERDRVIIQKTPDPYFVNRAQEQKQRCAAFRADLNSNQRALINARLLASTPVADSAVAASLNTLTAMRAYGCALPVVAPSTAISPTDDERACGAAMKRSPGQSKPPEDEPACKPVIERLKALN